MVVAEEPPGLVSLQLRCPLLLTRAPAEEGAAVQPVSPFPHRFTPSRLLCRGVEAHALVCFSDAGSTLILPWSPRVGGWEVTPSSLDPRGQSRRGLHGGEGACLAAPRAVHVPDFKAILSQLASAGAHCPLLPTASLP